MRSLFIVFALFPLVAMADGYTGAHGTNKLGELIYIGAGSLGSADDPADGIYVFKNRKSYLKGQLSKRYALLEECPLFSNAEGERFSCHKNGISPLAGATYRVTTSRKYKPCHDDTIGTVYVCVAGCNSPRVPRIFYKEPWECTP